MFVLAVLAIVAIAAPLLAPRDPTAQDLANGLRAPFTGGHLLGTDELGRDTLSRLTLGSRTALMAVGIALGIGVGLGVPLGVVAGYVGGRLDLLIVRTTEAVQSFPPLILAIAIISVRGPGLVDAMVAVGVVFAPSFFRVARASVAQVRQETYIEASRSIGSPARRIIVTRILPNALPPVLVQISLAAGHAVLAEAALSFLGLGVQAPDPSWGTMLGRGYRYLSQQPWVVIIPGVAIAGTTLAFNVLGDALNDSIGRKDRSD